MRSRTDAARVALRCCVMLLGAALAACQNAPGPQPVAMPAAASPNRVLTMTVYFDFDSHHIKPESYRDLDAVARAFADQRLSGLRYDINGHTDIVGRLAYNVALSQLRAQAVVDYLAARGVSRDDMRPQGFGALELINRASPASPENRRVEIVSVR